MTLRRSASFAVVVESVRLETAAQNRVADKLLSSKRVYSTFTVASCAFVLSCIIANGAEPAKSHNAVSPLGASESEASKKRAKEIYNTGRHFFVRNEFKRAIEEFTHAIDVRPKYSSAYFDRGRAKIQLKQYVDAIDDFKMVISLYPNVPHAYAQRGFCYMQIGQYSKGVDDCTTAIRLDPSDQFSIKNRMMAYEILGKHDLAKQDAERLKRPVVSGDWIRTCEEKMRHGKYHDAIAECNRCLSVNSKTYMAYYMRGLAYKKLEQYDNAIADFNTALSLNKNAAGSYYDRAQCYSETQQYGKALTDLNSAANLTPQVLKNPDFFKFRAIAFSGSGQFEMAIKDYSRMIELNPTNADAYILQAELFDKVGSIAKAIENYSQVIHLKPKDDTARFRRAFDLRKQGKYQEALNDYNALCNLNSKDEDAYKNRAEVLVLLKKYDQAVQDYTNAINADPSNAWRNYYARANVYEKLGRRDLAAADRKTAKGFGFPEPKRKDD